MKNRAFSILSLILIGAALMPLLSFGGAPRWGDLGDGTFANPVLNADYSDPDVIRVGDKYYLTCSEFHFMGMPILESTDMVNWRVIARVHDSLASDGYADMEKYGEGTWAPALRYHDGTYYIYVCSPNEGLWVTTAIDPAGPWTAPRVIKAVSGWEDPCPLWDEDGNAYLGRSELGGGPIYMHRMSPDGMQLLDDGIEVYHGPVAEGTKLFKKDGYYYLSIPEGGVSTGWQTVLRSSSIYGPYEGVRTLEQGSTDINGPHQGAYVDTPDGEWWFYHFQSTPVLGRVVHLQPVHWVDGFPQCGADYDGNGVGEPMQIVAKPATGASQQFFELQTSDDFSGSEIAVHWQFNHNPDMSRFSLSRKPGWLSIAPLQAPSLKGARNQLTQKMMGYNGTVETAIDITHMAASQRAGILCIGSANVGAGAEFDGQDWHVYFEKDGETTQIATLPTGITTLYLRLTYDTANRQNQYSYSLDGSEYLPLSLPFAQTEGNWKGSRLGLYTYSLTPPPSSASASFSHFLYTHDGPR
ncbi:MAG: glycoside hydrolase 43 family protein [Bacteroidales bacterium]|nr:glycoside hydrolase 43 family protein [Bacteroidales bacterium]